MTYFDRRGQAAKDTSASQDKLIDSFNHIELIFRRLEIYNSITPTVAMSDIIVGIMVEVLTILAIVTNEVRRGRISEWMGCIRILAIFANRLFRNVF